MRVFRKGGNDFDHPLFITDDKVEVMPLLARHIPFDDRAAAEFYG